MKATPHCAFCGDPLAEVELMFRSELGGEPPFICSRCVEGFGEVLKLHRLDPQAAARAIAQHNAAVGKRVT